LTPRARFFYRDPSAPQPTEPRALGVGALIERHGRLLLERRVDSGLWSLVAGRVEEDESLAGALVREVREETGLTVARYELFGTFTDPTRIIRYPDGNVLRLASFVYLVEVESFDGLRASDESEELRFFAHDELGGLDVPATQRPVFERYLAGAPPPHLE
jgi:8-oxo-dGTP pyrophosphatase MutT (NUDIX family)